jgi:hypothetical protein
LHFRSFAFPSFSSLNGLDVVNQILECIETLAKTEVNEGKACTENDHGNKYDRGVFRKLLLGGPDKLGEFALAVFEEFTHSGKNVRLFVSFICHVFLLRFFQKLLGFFVKRVFAAELAIFLHFKSVGIVLFVLGCVIVSLLAFRAGESDFNAHIGTSC